MVIEPREDILLCNELALFSTDIIKQLDVIFASYGLYFIS